MLKCILVESIKTKDYCVATLECEKETDVNPGQFIMIRNKTEPVLAKPFSVIFQRGKTIKLLIRIIGRFTKYISEAPLGEEFSVRGPNGKAFTDKIDNGRKYILIGGGCGSAPLIHFKERYPHMVAAAFYGFKTANIKEIYENESLVIEDLCGMTSVEAAYEKYGLLKSENPGVISCGTIPMHKAVISAFKNERNMKIYVSLDERMGCGIGMCKGCPVKTSEGIQMICKDGPIFDSDEIYLDW